MIIVLNESLVECRNEEITKELLNLIIDDEIKEVKLDYKEVLDKDILSDKAGILDIKAKLNDKIWCDIEMQVVDEKNIEKGFYIIGVNYLVHNCNQVKIMEYYKKQL